MKDRLLETGGNENTGCKVISIKDRERKNEWRPKSSKKKKSRELPQNICIPVCNEEKLLDNLSIEDRLILQGALIPHMTPEQKKEFIDKVIEMEECMSRGEELPINEVIEMRALSLFPESKRLRELYMRVASSQSGDTSELVLTNQEETELEEAFEKYSIKYADCQTEIVLRVFDFVRK